MQFDSDLECQESYTSRLQQVMSHVPAGASPKFDIKRLRHGQDALCQAKAEMLS